MTESQIVSALRTVQDPDVFKDIVTLNQLRTIKIFEGVISVEISTPSAQKEKLRQEITAAILKVEDAQEVFVSFATPVAAGQLKSAPQRGGQPPAGHAPSAPRGIPGVKYVVAVGAGKGGVGKSTVAVNLALGLALSGKKVAILDGDIYGPSIPTLTGVPPQLPQVVNDRIIPFTITSPAHPGVSLAVMSIGFMVDKEKALIWRGPMAHSAMKQMIEQVEWISPERPAIDYLIVDLPPGTGDVSLTLAQTVPLTGAMIVATPQEVALADARRAVRMFQQLSVEILGVVENMSHFICDHGTSYDIFGRGGAHLMAQQMGLAFLGDLPIHTALRKNSDSGTPFANFAEASPSRQPLMALADQLDKQVAVRMATRPSAKPLNLQIS
ncbi:MAG TPA: Mrp/NBP35 family ATP-binding protein [Phycisphaerae bacterium]